MCSCLSRPNFLSNSAVCAQSCLFNSNSLILDSISIVINYFSKSAFRRRKLYISFIKSRLPNTFYTNSPSDYYPFASPINPSFYLPNDPNPLRIFVFPDGYSSFVYFPVVASTFLNASLVNSCKLRIILLCISPLYLRKFPSARINSYFRRDTSSSYSNLTSTLTD